MRSDPGVVCFSDVMTSLDLDIVRMFYPSGKYVPLSAILYSSEQATLARHNQSLSVVKTFRLGSVFVTMSCFKNENFKFKPAFSSTTPTMIGPTLIHTANDFLSYDAFFSHLNDAIFDTSTDLTIMHLNSNFPPVFLDIKRIDALLISMDTFCGERLRISKDVLVARNVRATLSSALTVKPNNAQFLDVVKAFEKVVFNQHFKMRNALYALGEYRLASHVADDVMNRFGWECSLLNREPASCVHEYVINLAPQRNECVVGDVVKKT